MHCESVNDALAQLYVTKQVPWANTWLSTMRTDTISAELLYADRTVPDPTGDQQPVKKTPAMAAAEDMVAAKADPAMAEVAATEPPVTVRVEPKAAETAPPKEAAEEQLAKSQPRKARRLATPKTAPPSPTEVLSAKRQDSAVRLPPRTTTAPPCQLEPPSSASCRSVTAAPRRTSKMRVAFDATRAQRPEGAGRVGAASAGVAEQAAGSEEISRLLPGAITRAAGTAM